MIADTINPVFTYTPPAPDSVGKHFDMVTRINDASLRVKVKDTFGEAATTNLLNMMSARAEELRRVNAAARKTEMQSAAIAMTPLVLGGLASVAIWRLNAKANDLGTQHLTNGLHLLDISRLGERYFSQLIVRYGGRNVRDGKRGEMALPPEIWLMIIELLQADRHPGEYCFVRTSTRAPVLTPLTIPRSSNLQLVRCIRYNFDEDPIKPLVAGNC
ncbi:hypothetical protein B0H67DRAFT_640845 [Lasiosphaeris hirsuta]|uniref:Uncharacterized protein n=1 Tax=Lasiosphaeris hirsuta TaxID=260670 RepID=A0AA40AYG7_9PEZI|nr:hypothetical protein B0H67DRAFT_640845 [Lasiosphaeris hirsuta]